MEKKSPNNSILTIVLVSYNNSNNVDKTLTSLLNLQKINYETIIVDSSNDKKVYNLYRKYEKQFRIRYYFQEAKGVYSAMNLAINKSNIESYIWFLNPGDTLFSPLVLQKLLIKLENSSTDWGFGQAKNEKPQDYLIYPKDLHSLSPKLIALGQVQISHQAILVKTRKLIELGKFSENYKIASDLEMIIKLSRHNYCFLREILVSIELNGLSRKNPLKTILETNYIVYNSGYRSFLGAIYNLFKSLVSLMFGTLVTQIVRILKKLGHIGNEK